MEDRILKNGEKRKIHVFPSYEPMSCNASDQRVLYLLWIKCL